MTDQDKQRFLRTLTAMSEMFGKDCSAGLIDLYFMALKDLAIEEIEAAVVGLIAGHHGPCSFMPKPAEIREVITGPAPKTSPSERAWVRLLEMVKTLHECNRVECDDPAIAKALRVVFGSWDYAVHRLFFDAGIDQIGRAVLRKEFISAYEIALAECLAQNISNIRCVLRRPQGALLPGNAFALGLSDSRGVRVCQFRSEAEALAWLDRAALPPAPVPASLVAHEDDDPHED